jgi:NADPH-dependent curcumin reductase CurA
MPQSKTVNRRILLASRPDGPATADNFKTVEEPVPAPGAGEMLCRSIYQSLDPYMRGRMSAARSYAKPVEIGDVMTAGVVAEVIESNVDGFAPGDIVNGAFGWQDYALSKGRGVRKLDPTAAPISTALGVLGMPGLTAYVGLRNIGQPKEGETVVVSAASGAVGAVVGQIAKMQGCRVIGIAGAQEKCFYVVNELDFDACVSHREKNLPAALESACPDGIDVYWENVGGPVFAAVMPLLNDFARIPVCGQIAHYSETGTASGPDRLPALMGQVLRRRMRMQGFIVYDFGDQEPDFQREMSAWIRDGKVKYKEDLVDGLENAVTAFLGLLEGKNFGKLIVRVGDDPTA